MNMAKKFMEEKGMEWPEPKDYDPDYDPDLDDWIEEYRITGKRQIDRTSILACICGAIVLIHFLISIFGK